MIELLDKMEMLIYLDFEKNEKFKNAETAYSSIVKDDIILKAKAKGIDDNVAAFYKVSNGFRAIWDYDLDTEGRTFGHLKILKIEESILGDDWEDFFYADGADIRLKHFKPLDYCSVDNMYCGLVLDDSGDQAMYSYDFSEADLLPLDIDFKSYFELAIDAKVMYGWQDYLIHQITPRNFIIDFPEKMKIFPDFDLEAFTAKFENLRLSKKKVKN